MRKKISRRILILFICIFTIGVSIIWWVADSTDKKMRAELLLHSRIAAQAINIKYVASLSGSKEDLNKPAYQRIKSQLASMRKAIDNCRFLYMMGRRSDGKVFFFMDSLPPDSKDYAPPGLVYDEVSDSYIRTFESNMEAVVGPVTDRWGTLITALVPLKDPNQGNLIAVLGMDIDAKHWNEEILSRCFFPFTIMLLFMFLILLLFSREKVAKSLRQSENKLRATLDATPFPVAVVDLNDDKIFYWSHSALTLFGHTAPTTSEWYQTAYPDPVYRKEAIEKWKSFLNKAQKTGQPINTGEYRVACKDSSERICELYATFLPENLIVTFNDITDRKRAEEDLSQIFSMSLDMICIADINTSTFIKVNPAFTAILGYSEEELLEKPFLDFVHPDDIDTTLAIIDKKLKAGAKVINFENRYRCKDGSYRWLSWVGHPSHDLGVTYSVARDITEWKQNEETLKKNKALLDATGRMAKVGGWELDADTLEVTWTDETYRIHEVPVGQKPSLEEAINFFHPEDRPQLEQAIQRALDHGEPYDMETRFVTAKGKHLWTRTICRPETRNGKTVKLQGTFQDITERKQAETAVRDSEEQFRHFFEHLTIGVAVYEALGDGEDFLLIDMNPAGQKLSKVSIDEIRGERLTKVFPGVRDLGLFVALQNTWRTGQPTHIPFSQYKDESITQWVENRVFRLPSGKVVAIYDDRTEIMRLEEQLRQAQKMEAVGNLAGGVAHDYNNMLSIIIGYAESALEELDIEEPLYEYITEILEAGKRSADITKQLLAFSRQQTTAPKVLDLNVNIEDMLKMLRRLIGEDIDLAWLPDTDVWPVKIDPSQLDQILANLCVNAKDAIEGIGKVTIETKNAVFDEEYCANHAGFVPGEYVLLALSDTGGGIPHDMLDNIFEPFFTTKKLHQGTGLGLSTVYGIVKQNNGFINVYSEPEEGTTLRIYFPRHLGQIEADRRETAQEIPSGQGETILLVEDDPSILKLGMKMLKGLGYKVLSEVNPNKAINTAKRHTGEIHLLVTDVVMPEMNGRELSEELKKQYSNLKTLFMSGYTANVIAHRGVLEDGVHFISKPLSKKELAEKVRETLDNAQ